jgi:hypothetical protein
MGGGGGEQPQIDRAKYFCAEARLILGGTT